MAMTKKGQERVETLLTQSTLRSTYDVDPDIFPGRDAGLVTGFLPVCPASDSARVEVACSSAVFHGIGRTDKTSSQGARKLYSTRLLALQALRYQVEQDCARRLRRIDMMMEREREAAQSVTEQEI